MPKGSHVHVQGRLVFEDKGNPSVLAERVYMVDKSMSSPDDAGEAIDPPRSSPEPSPQRPSPPAPQKTARGRTAHAGAGPTTQEVQSMSQEELWNLVMDRPELW